MLCGRLQIVFGIIVAVTFAALLLSLQPFVQDSDDILATVAQWVIVVQLFAGLLVRMQAHLDRIRALLPVGSSIEGNDQYFDFSATSTVVVAAAFVVPVFALLVSAVESSNGAWKEMLGRYEGTPEADELRRAPILWRPFVMLTKQRRGGNPSRVRNSAPACTGGSSPVVGAGIGTLVQGHLATSTLSGAQGGRAGVGSASGCGTTGASSSASPTSGFRRVPVRGRARWQAAAAAPGDGLISSGSGPGGASVGLSGAASAVGGPSINTGSRVSFINPLHSTGGRLPATGSAQAPPLAPPAPSSMP
jgi:hypothetical protein